MYEHKLKHTSMYKEIKSTHLNFLSRAMSMLVSRKDY